MHHMPIMLNKLYCDYSRPDSELKVKLDILNKMLQTLPGHCTHIYLVIIKSALLAGCPHFNIHICEFHVKILATPHSTELDLFVKPIIQGASIWPHLLIAQNLKKMEIYQN